MARLDDAAPLMPEMTWLARYTYAASLLYVAGFITATERRRIAVRMEKQARREDEALKTLTG